MKYIVVYSDGRMLAGDGACTDYYLVREYPDAFKYSCIWIATRHANRADIGLTFVVELA